MPSDAGGMENGGFPNEEDATRKGLRGMEIEIHEQELPFEIPDSLREILTENAAEYGTGGGIGTYLPCTRAWVVRRGSQLIGFAWVSAKNLEGGKQASYFSQAVLLQARGRGYGQRVRLMVENTLRDEGVPNLYVQVNNKRAETGLKVRERLLSSGYAVDRSQLEDRFLPQEARPMSQRTDLELVRSCVMPLHFKKPLQ